MNKILYTCFLFFYATCVFSQEQSNDAGEGVFYTLEEAQKDPLNVKVLILEHQNLDKVPEVLSQFINMEVLSLKGNALSSLPLFFSSLIHLHDLNLG